MGEQVYFGLGSNLGDRQAHLCEALRLMDEVLGKHYTRLSSFVETPSWGFEGQDFINCVVMYELDGGDPFTVLDQCKSIEARMGRTDAPQWDESGHRLYHDRVIDIDILLYGSRRVSSPSLTIPHPLMRERDFVMGPLKEIYQSK